MGLNMLNRIIILLFFLFSSNAFANEGKFKLLSKGYRAPYSGVLFDKNAVSSLLAMKDRLVTECDLNMEFEINKLSTTHKLEIDKLKLDMKYLKDQHTIEMNGKKLQVANLQKELKKRNGVNKSWYIVGGFAVGVLTTTTIVWSVK